MEDFMFDLGGRVALVTGAGRHVGRAIALALAQQGAAVGVNDLSAERAESVAKEIAKRGGRALALAADVTDLSAVRAMVARLERDLGPVDILVNNAGNAGAGSFPTQPFREIDPAEWPKFVDVNFYGVLNCIHAVADGMCARGWGRIITISSDAGRTGDPLGISVYGGAKAGAVGFQRHLATELGPHGVTVNALALGMIPQGWTPPSPRRTPMRRHGTPEDVAPAVVYLASEEAAWTTGQTLSVNGGFVT
jgi:NAD(P)-dependent dehydrogenase (short-subunit alcohol dehydrogenase family)